jgi:uncharacterized membrane protein (UPF0182 family)
MFKNIKTSLLFFALFFIGSTLFSDLLPDFFWFKSIGYSSIWLFKLKAEWAAFAAFFVTALFFISLNVRLANKNSESLSGQSQFSVNTPFKALNNFLEEFQNNQKVVDNPAKNYARKWLLRVVCIVVSVFFGLTAKHWWQEAFLYVNQDLYGLTDPIFNKDISYYLFTLPFFNHIQNWFLGLLIITSLIVGWIYFSKNILLVIFSKNTNFKSIKTHFILLLSLTFTLLAIGSHFSIYELVYSTRGAVFGAAYTDISIILPIKKLLVALFTLQALSCLFLLRNTSIKLPYLVFITIVLTHILALNILPNLIQNYVVSPNELEKEKKYIETNIAFTREAYKLTSIQTQDFPAKTNLSLNDIQKNSAIIDNIRLWNQEPLKQTFSQLQEIRPYYEFANVDVDRYLINGKLQQVMLSARELESNDLSAQAQTWINKHLVYTHGYGACMTPVNKITEDGLPEFFIKDLPPQSSIDLKITRPEVYFGEKTNNYVIVNTKQSEFDYPKGELNVYTNYSGKGGIHLDTHFKRALFAFKLGDSKLLVSSQINKQSRLMYDRNIDVIVRKIAPFLTYDKDPYLVITNEGRMKWILDAYTMSKYFPYSQPIKGNVNYIRNSVKVVIDAYDGTVDFYIADSSDPIIRAYSKIYVGLFKNISEMPDSLKSHLRYPTDLFTVQALMYSTYHMTDPQVFYNREDLWSLPTETYGESEQTMQPYYLITRLPGDVKESFVLMLPFTPTNKNNMIAWIAVKCDPENYGEFTVLNLPKDRTIYGPKQIESRIDQDTEISKDLTLWGQVGSRVIRGNLMIIPIEESILYVEPVYLQATQSKMPELKRVIVSYADAITMNDNLSESIQFIFGGNSYSEKKDITSEAVKTEKVGTTKKVKEIFKDLKKQLQQSEWGNFGQKMEELEKAIGDLTD